MKVWIVEAYDDDQPANWVDSVWFEKDQAEYYVLKLEDDETNDNINFEITCVEVQ